MEISVSSPLNHCKADLASAPLSWDIKYLGVSGIKQTNIRKGNGNIDPARAKYAQSSQNPKM